MNNFNADYMRTEIAVLQEDVDASNPGTAAFKIPVLMTDDTVALVSINNTNLLNRRNGTMTSATLDINNTIDLFIPTEYTYFAGVDTIPAGSRFVVAFVGGNPNDIKIIGRYDYDLGKEDVVNGIIG